MGVDRARDDGEACAVDDLRAVEAVPHGSDPSVLDRDAGAGEPPRAGVYESVAKDELRRHYYALAGAGIAPGLSSAALAMSTIASPGAVDARAGLLNPSSCFAFAAPRTTATSAM